MRKEINRRQFLAQSALASAGLAAASETQSTAAESAVSPSPVVPGAKGILQVGKIGTRTISRLITGGNLLSGWCHQRDLLFVRNLAEAYLTEQKQFDTLQMLEERGVNTIVLDMIQIDIVNKYKKQRGGKIQVIASVRENWGDWSNPKGWAALKTEIRQAIDKGPDLLYLHGGYVDQLAKTGKPENMHLIAQSIEFMREQKFTAGIGAHELAALKECDKSGIKCDFYVKTFHHDKYWSATPKANRKPYSVDSQGSLDHNEFHDNIFCLDPEATAEYMFDKTEPWIAFKVLAAGAIAPRSGFKYAFENGADFITVGMFDFEVNEDIQALKESLEGLQRERQWRG